MSAHRSIDILCVVVLALSILLTVLFMNGDALGVERIVDEDAEAYSDSVYFTANDLNGGWDAADATVITLAGTDASISGGGAYAYDGDVYITNGGYYVLSGELTDGSIVVDAYASSKVWLKLEGVSVTCSDGAALRVEQADKVFLTLADGTENASAEMAAAPAPTDGSNGGSHEMRAGPGMDAASGEPETETETPVSAAKAVTPEQWLWIGVSAAALLAGLGFVLLYRRRR